MKVEIFRLNIGIRIVFSERNATYTVTLPTKDALDLAEKLADNARAGLEDELSPVKVFAMKQ